MGSLVFGLVLSLISSVIGLLVAVVDLLVVVTPLRVTGGSRPPSFPPSLKVTGVVGNGVVFVFCVVVMGLCN